MLLSSMTMRLLLVLCLTCMLALAIHYLRRRELSAEAFIGWGLLALLLPLVGPFMVISRQPGKPHKNE